jgi:heme/copper-type cytochrome/quinol oxidase subunit 2
MLLRTDLRAPAAGLCLIATLTLAACGGEAEEPSGASSPTVSVTPSAGEASSPAAATATPTPDDAQAISITVAGGQATGDTGRVEVPVGTKVRLTITSDAADEVHVHGFDLTTALSPGQAAQLEFVADRTGIFEVELHDAGTVLTRLQVQ